MEQPIRIGNGYDVHALAFGLPLWIGGIRIEHNKGLMAHSDGDVLIHALCDALFGALALGDIGQHFPDNAPEFRGIDSKILLQRCMQQVTEKGYRVGNVDCTILAQAPRLRPHIGRMQETLAPILGVEPDAVSIKATTTERLGCTGREEGIAVYATALLFHV